MTRPRFEPYREPPNAPERYVPDEEQTITVAWDGNTVTHEMDAYGNHRVLIAGIPRDDGGWADYTAIAQHRSLYATTPYYDGVLPEIFTITTIVEAR